MADFSIRKYCVLDGKSVNVNGKQLFFKNGLSVKEYLSEVYRFAGMEYPKFFKMDLLSKAGILASDFLLQHESESDAANDDNRGDDTTAIILANSSSSLDTDRNYNNTISGKDYFPSPSVFVYTLPNIVLGEIAIKNKFYGESCFYVLNIFDADAIFDYFCNLIDGSKIQRAIVGWVECTAQNCDVLALLVERKKGELIFNTDNIKNIRNERT